MQEGRKRKYQSPQHLAKNPDSRTCKKPTLLVCLKAVTPTANRQPPTFSHGRRAEAPSGNIEPFVCYDEFLPMKTKEKPIVHNQRQCRSIWTLLMEAPHTVHC
jgi:hypothetical protein